MAFEALGNVPEFEFTPNVEKLDHFSSQTGVRTKDKSVVLEASGTLRIVMDELTANNLRLALLGTVSINTAGDEEIDILADVAIAARVKFVGTNDIGRKLTWNFDRVEFAPSSAINMISDEWLSFEVTGEVVAVAGKFGTVTFPGEGTTGDTPPDIANYTIGKGVVSIEIIA